MRPICSEDFFPAVERRKLSQNHFLKFILTLILSASVHSLFSQRPTKLDTSLNDYRQQKLYNAYAVSREVLRTERQLGNWKGEKLSKETKDSIRILLSALVWYANLQDRSTEEQISLVLPTIQSSYSSVFEELKKILLKLNSLAFLVAKNETESNRHFWASDTASLGLLKSNMAL